jgi:oxygen-independent coproporphyrinogen III oxidase
MAGIYIHIPFCKQACHYCNFHFSTTFSSYKTAMVNALQREIILQADFFGTTNKELDSVYFGGGTPSLLSAEEHITIWETLLSRFKLKPGAEITFEANPDDMSDEWLQHLRDTPVNRLSVGIQSFHEQDLKYLHRAHSGQDARTAVEKALRAGITQISADLIFGIPSSGAGRLESDARLLTQLGFDHISVYGLTVEPKTALEKMIHSGKRTAVDEEKSASEMELIMELLPSLGLEQYEISNFAAPGHEAIHNSNYWEGKPYLGIGPSAHSFKAHVRTWNVSNNAAYIKSIHQNSLPSEREILSLHDRFNEVVMTRLRTIKGLDATFIDSQFGGIFRQHLEKELEMFLQSGEVLKNGSIFSLSQSGRLKADFITQQLFLLNES